MAVGGPGRGAGSRSGDEMSTVDTGTRSESRTAIIPAISSPTTSRSQNSSSNHHNPLRQVAVAGSRRANLPSLPTSEASGLSADTRLGQASSEHAATDRVATLAKTKLTMPVSTQMCQSPSARAPVPVEGRPLTSRRRERLNAGVGLTEIGSQTAAPTAASHQRSLSVRSYASSSAGATTDGYSSSGVESVFITSAPLVSHTGSIRAALTDGGDSIGSLNRSGSSASTIPTSPDTEPQPGSHNYRTGKDSGMASKQGQPSPADT